MLCDRCCEWNVTQFSINIKLSPTAIKIPSLLTLSLARARCGCALQTISNQILIEIIFPSSCKQFDTISHHQNWPFTSKFQFVAVNLRKMLSLWIAVRWSYAMEKNHCHRYCLQCACTMHRHTIPHHTARVVIAIRADRNEERENKIDRQKSSRDSRQRDKRDWYMQQTLVLYKQEAAEEIELRLKMKKKMR